MFSSVFARGPSAQYFGVSRRIQAVAAKLAEMRHAVKGRRELARMDARMLSDIGLSPCDALTEINRRPWDTGQKP